MPADTAPEITQKLPDAETGEKVSPPVPPLSGPRQTLEGLADAAEGDNTAQTAEVRHQLLIDKLFSDNDPRKELASMFPSGISEKALIEQTTLSYIKNLTAEQHVPNPSVEEAQKAFSDIVLERSRQQALVDQSKTNGEPIPSDIHVDEKGKVIIDEAKVAVDAIKGPRINARIAKFSEEGLTKFLDNAEDKKVIDTALNINPDVSFSEIQEKVYARRRDENRIKVDEALNLLPHLGLTSEQMRMLDYIVDDYRESNPEAPVDKKVYPLLMKGAANLRMNEIIKSYPVSEYPWEFDREKILADILNGKDPVQSVEKYKKGKNTSIFDGMASALLKKIFSSTTSGE